MKRIAILLLTLVALQASSQQFLNTGTFDATGTNTYTVTGVPGLQLYSKNLLIKIRFINANSAASTININSIGTVALQNAGVALASGEIKSGGTYQLSWNGTNFQVLGIGGSGGGGTSASLAEAQAGTDNTKVMTPLRVAETTQRVYNVKAYGAKGDTKSVNDGAINSGTNLLNSATAAFVAGDVGKTVEIPGAGTAGANLVVTITARNSATQVLISSNASTTVANKKVWFGTDDTAAIQSAINACFAAGATDVYFPLGIYMIAGALVTSDINGLNPNSQLYIPSAPINASINSFTPRAIRLLGESYSPLTNTSVLNNDQIIGSVLKSTLNQGTGTRPSIIGGIGFTTGNVINKMNYTTMMLEHINVVASSNGGFTCPNLIAVNALDHAQFIFKNGSVNMDCYLYESTMPNPSTTATNSAGIITGRRDNNGGNIVENVWVQGAWHRAFVFGEHTYPKFTWAMGCHTAYTFLDSNFEIVGDIGSNTVVNYLEFPNATLYGEVAGNTFVDLKFNYEASGVGGSPPSWLVPTNLLTDVGKKGRGTIKYNAQGGTEVGNFSTASNEYGLYVTSYTRLLPQQVNQSGGAISSGYGTTLAFGDQAVAFEIGNPTQQTGSTTEISTFIQSAKTNLTDAIIAQRLVMNNHGSSGLAADPNEKRVYAELYTNDGASLNGRVYENIFTNSNKRVSERTGDLQKWFTNGVERFNITNSGFTLLTPITLGLYANDAAADAAAGGSAVNGTIYANSTTGQDRIKVSGTWRDGSASVYGLADGGNATNAGFTAVANTFYYLPSATLSADRTITMPASANGSIIEFYNNETGFNWLIGGDPIYLSDNTTTITALLTNTNTIVKRVNGRWRISN